MIKFSRATFYKNHNNEIEKFISKNLKVLHLTSKSSQDVKLLESIETITINPEERFSLEDFNTINSKYDLVIITDIFEVSSDIYGFIKTIKTIINNDGKILLTSINPKWNNILKVVEFFNLKQKSSINSYIQPKNVSNIFKSLGFEKIKSFNKQIFPFRLLGLGTIFNIILELIFGYFNLGIKTYFLYQLSVKTKSKYSKTIIIPAKNEEGNLDELISRIPNFDTESQIIIACGPSRDKTYEKAIEIQNKRKDLEMIVFKQTKNGKANAVWEALEYSSCEIIAILDSDISVDPEELDFFFEIIETGNCDFVNGTRLMYPMEDSAMRAINKLGNRTFQLIISKLIGINLSDTLCGTKVFKKSNIENLKTWQEKMSVADPFCDFDLIFSSANSGAKILEYPVHYRNRTYGTTNISRFRDGWKLILYLVNSLLFFKTSY